MQPTTLIPKVKTTPKQTSEEGRIELTQFLTINSDPTTGDSWYRFRAEDTLRSDTPPYSKLLEEAFKDKPAGSYLVQCSVQITLTVIDSELKQGTLPEASETSDLPWTEPVLDENYEDRF